MYFYLTVDFHPKADLKNVINESPIKKMEITF